MDNSRKRKKVSARPPRPRSLSQSGRNTPITGEDGDRLGDSDELGNVYLRMLDPPALPPTSDVYHEVYASVRATLEGFHWRHAPTAVKAAWDASASYITQSLAMGGGQTDEQ